MGTEAVILHTRKAGQGPSGYFGYAMVLYYRLRYAIHNSEIHDVIHSSEMDTNVQILQSIIAT